MPDDSMPMTDGDITPPPATTTFQTADPLKTTGTAADEEGGTLDGGRVAAATQTVRDSATKLSQQAGDKARYYAEEGKTRAGGALDQLSQLLTDAAGQVDDKLGDQYGQYARSAAGAISDLAGKVQAKSVDELIDDARGLVRQSPAIAIGAAAAVGFVLARLISSGIDQRDA